LLAVLTYDAAGTLTGCRNLWQKYHRTAPPTQSAQAKPAISPEDLLHKHARGIVAQHYTIAETLTPLNLISTETHSAYEHSGTVDLVEHNGLTFHVTISSPTYGWRVTHIIRGASGGPPTSKI
jgi:hypothetical protein